MEKLNVLFKLENVIIVDNQLVPKFKSKFITEF